MKPRDAIIPAILVSNMLLVSSAFAQFSQQGPKLVGSGAIGAAQQGSATALSADGNTAIIGGFVDNLNSGAAWVWTRNGGVWTQQSGRLIGSGPASGAQGISVSLSADGNTALVGGHNDSNGIGAAWAWTRTSGAWSEQAKLVGSGGNGFPHQGLSVSLSADGNTAIVGAPSDNTNAGAAWIWNRIGGNWIEQKKLFGTAAAGPAQQGYGVAVSGDGNTAIVGAPQDSPQGAVWIWRKNGGVWLQTSKLVATGGVGLCWQGYSVALSADGTTAVVGAPADNSFMGAIWVWSRNGESWTPSAKLVAPTAIGPVQQGRSVSLSADGNTAIVGGFGDNSNSGAAWIWTRSGSTWTVQSPKLLGSGAVGTPQQGCTVAISGDGHTVLSSGCGDNFKVGAVWAFTDVPARRHAAQH